MLRRALFPALATMLGGCIPAPYGAYYRPSYPDPSSSLGRAYCGGQAGPSSNLTFAGPPGVTVAVTAERPYTDRNSKDRPLRITVNAPAGSRLQFLSDEIQISETQDRPARSVAPEVLARTSLQLPADASVNFGDAGPASVEAARKHLRAAPGNVLARVTSLQMELSDFNPAEIELVLPPIQVGERLLMIAPQRLRSVGPARGRMVTVFRTADYARALDQRSLACMKDTPQNRCENIKTFDEGSFTLELDEFTVTATVSKWGEVSTAPLRYTVEVSARTADTWRFLHDGLVFKDLRSSELRRERMGHLFVSWSLPVPLSAPVSATNAGQAPKTAITISAGLGEKDARRYRVKLPPLLFNGAPYQLHPIDLELRSLDGGLEPFNC